MALFLLVIFAAGALQAQPRTGRYDVFETAFQSAATYNNPYVQASAAAAVTRPGGSVRSVPLFWAGGTSWRLRISPDTPGKWSFRVTSADRGLDGRSGSFECIESGKAGGIRASSAWPGHFERQNGSPFWFMGDTAWGYFTDDAGEKHDRERAQYYLKKRAGQGFSVIHSMLLSEAATGNRNGPPFDDLSTERINPGYWDEVDERVRFANSQGVTVGLAIAWGDKRKVEPYAWRRFPGLEARRRYARYVAARYGAYDVYFLVSGEWHGEVRTRENTSEEAVFEEFVQIGDALSGADFHRRMIGIHPMTRAGTVREFAAALWMSFADYQQNYHDLHARALLSRRLRGPVVNGEYGYHLRDQDGDGKPDKSNSYSAEDMRFASWDILTAGAFLVTGFGTTYFAGHRDPGPFDPDAPRNREWEAQMGHLRKFFTGLEWWKLIPADELISCAAPRSPDRSAGRGNDVRPPAATYWAMAAPGSTYLVYVRGTTQPVKLDTQSRPRTWRVRQFNPRTGEFQPLPDAQGTSYSYAAPDPQDWVALLEAK